MNHAMLCVSDIKPDNFLVTEDWELKLTDLGEARVCAHDRAMTITGSPLWQAPELLQGGSEGKFNEKVDIYSLSIVFWQMLTGQHDPYPGVSRWRLAQAVIGGQRPVFPPETPAAFRCLLERGWAADPATRPTAKEMSEALLALS